MAGATANPQCCLAAVSGGAQGCHRGQPTHSICVAHCAHRPGIFQHSLWSAALGHSRSLCWSPLQRGCCDTLLLALWHRGQPGAPQAAGTQGGGVGTEHHQQLCCIPIWGMGAPCSPRGAQGVPALVPLALLWHAWLSADPHTVTLCIPHNQALGTSSAPWFSSCIYLPYSWADKTTDTCLPSPPVPLGSTLSPSLLLSLLQAAFSPGNPGCRSPAAPLPHQLLTTVLPGGSTNYPIPSLRDHSPWPRCGHMASPMLPKPLPTGPAPLPKPALSTSLMTLN